MLLCSFGCGHKIETRGVGGVDGRQGGACANLTAVNAQRPPASQSREHRRNRREETREEIPMRNDNDLKRDIEEELGWIPDIDDTDIGVSVKNGVATVTGFVKSYNEK